MEPSLILQGELSSFDGQALEQKRLQSTVRPLHVFAVEDGNGHCLIAVVVRLSRIGFARKSQNGFFQTNTNLR